MPFPPLLLCAPNFWFGFCEHRHSSVAAGACSESVERWKLGYDKVDVIKACPVTAAQIQPGLPPVGFGGQLNLLDGLESDLHYLFSDPLRCRLPESRLPDEIPQPKAMVESDDGWHAAVSLLHQRGVVAATKLDSVPRVQGRALLQGAFGVHKPSKFLSADVPCFASLWIGGSQMQS